MLINFFCFNSNTQNDFVNTERKNFLLFGKKLVYPVFYFQKLKHVYIKIDNLNNMY